MANARCIRAAQLQERGDGFRRPSSGLARGADMLALASTASAAGRP